MSYKKIKNMTAAILLGCAVLSQENIFYSSGI